MDYLPLAMLKIIALRIHTKRFILIEQFSSWLLCFQMSLNNGMQFRTILTVSLSFVFFFFFASASREDQTSNTAVKEREYYDGYQEWRRRTCLTTSQTER